jgi:soluble lytic murein transglycosylase
MKLNSGPVSLHDLRKLTAAALALFLVCAILSAPPTSSAAPCQATGSGQTKSRAKSAHAKPNPATTATHSTAVPKWFQTSARALKENKNPSVAYKQLSAFAAKSSTVLGMRAALALGYFDYTKGQYADATTWLNRALGDPLLRDYALYWKGETDLAAGHSADALAEFQEFREKYPDSVMNDQALQGLVEAAIAADQPAQAVAALEAYPGTTAKPSLLLLRGEAHEKAGQPVAAATDYEALYTGYPLLDQGRSAGVKLDLLRTTFASQIPQLPLDQRLAHANTLFTGRDWNDARDEYSRILPELSGADNERAELRILECGLSIGASPAEVTALKISDPDVDAERSYFLAQYYRGLQNEAEMVAAVDSAASRAPSSYWTEESFFLAGNYYWVQLNRDKAASYYSRLMQLFPTAGNADAAHWRVTWTAVIERQANDAELLQEHLKMFPASSYTPDALYWLGRLADEAGVQPLARGYYTKLIDRYPENYFGKLAMERRVALGPGPEEVSATLTVLPQVPVVPSLDNPIPPAAKRRQDRAEALQSIAFDSSAELELRAAYTATGEPRLLLEAAQAAVAAEQYGAAIVTVRQLVPRLDSHTLMDVPRPVWLAAYALPYESSIKRWAARAGVDPMLVAGLIHQESAFEPTARSGSNALGLMQLIPPTAHRMAKESKIRFSQLRLFEPDYNVRLGTVYLSDLHKQFGTDDAVLAAYNAGEDRVVSWTSGQNYRETAEFVESIPFTQTREYVEIVSRNADIYRRLYGAQNELRTTRNHAGH